MVSVRKYLSDNNITENGGIDYANAVISAREGDSAGVTSNLKSALSKNDDGSIKERLVNDIEFSNYSDAVKAAMN